METTAGSHGLVSVVSSFPQEPIQVVWPSQWGLMAKAGDINLTWIRSMTG